jgi:hypothetical protein
MSQLALSDSIGHFTSDTLIEPRQIHDGNAVYPALEQFAQRQHPTALLAHRDDDFLDPMPLDDLEQALAGRKTRAPLCVSGEPPSAA